MGKYSNLLRKAWAKYDRSYGALVEDKDGDRKIDSCCAIGGMALSLGMHKRDLRKEPSTITHTEEVALAIDAKLGCDLLSQYYTQVFRMNDKYEPVEAIYDFLDEREFELCGGANETE